MLDTGRRRSRDGETKQYGFCSAPLCPRHAHYCVVLRCRCLLRTEHNCMAYHCGSFGLRFLTKPYLFRTRTKLYRAISSAASSRHYTAVVVGQQQQQTRLACTWIAALPRTVRTGSRRQVAAPAAAAAAATARATAARRRCPSRPTEAGAGSSCSARSSHT